MNDTLPHQTLFSYLLTIAIAIGGLMLLYLHWQIVICPVVIDLFEGVQPHFTALLAAGGNPYTAVHQPLYTNAYPPLYNAVSALFLDEGSNTLLLHRAISGACILLSCGFVTWAARHAGLAWNYAVYAAVLTYAGLQYYSTIVASSNSMGTMFFLASVLLPWRYSFNNLSLLASALCVVLAFFSKQYFALGLPIVALYAALFVSFWRGTVYSLLGAVLLISSVLAVDAIGPFFLENILFAMGNVVDAIDNANTVIRQLLIFGAYYSPLAIAVVIAILIDARSKSKSVTTDGEKPQRSGSALIKQVTPDYFLFAFAISALAIVFVLGRNPGNHMTYLFQLMSPFAILYLLKQLNGRSKAAYMAPLLALNLGVGYAMLPKDTTPDMSGWQRAYQLIEQHDNILNSSVLTYALMERKKTIANGGLDSMFRFATITDTPLQSAERRLLAIKVWEAYKNNIRQQFLQQRYDALMIFPGEMNHLLLSDEEQQEKGAARRIMRQYYQLEEQFEISLTDRLGGGTKTLQLWLPLDAPKSELDG